MRTNRSETRLLLIQGEDYAQTHAGCLLLTLLALAAPVVSGQSKYASLSGTVFDPQRQAVAGATVQVRSASTRAARQVTTDAEGAFQIDALLPGEYELTVQAQGFATLTRTVSLEVGRQVTLDVDLKLSSLSTSVEVKDDPVVLRTSDASVGEIVEPAAVRNLPLNGRMLIDLVLTVPGAHLSHGAQAGDMSPLYWRPASARREHRRQRPNANYFLPTARPPPTPPSTPLS